MNDPLPGLKPDDSVFIFSEQMCYNHAADPCAYSAFQPHVFFSCPDPAWAWDLGLDPARPTSCLLHVCPRGASYYDLVSEEQITTCNFYSAQKHNKDQN